MTGEIYKWVDENGQTVYSATAPSGHSVQVLRPAPQASAQEQARAQERLQQDLQRVETLRLARMKAAQEEDQARRERIERDSRCNEAQLQLRFLEETQPLRWVEPGRTGSEVVHWLSDEEKDLVVHAWRQEITVICEASGALSDPAPARPAVVGPPR